MTDEAFARYLEAYHNEEEQPPEYSAVNERAWSSRGRDVPMLDFRQTDEKTRRLGRHMSATETILNNARFTRKTQTICCNGDIVKGTIVLTLLIVLLMAAMERAPTYEMYRNARTDVLKQVHAAYKSTKIALGEPETKTFFSSTVCIFIAPDILFGNGKPSKKCEDFFSDLLPPQNLYDTRWYACRSESAGCARFAWGMAMSSTLQLVRRILENGPILIGWYLYLLVPVLCGYTLAKKIVHYRALQEFMEAAEALEVHARDG